MNELQTRRDIAKSKYEARKILDRATTEGRDMSPEEEEKFDALVKVVDDLSAQVKSLLAGEVDEASDDEDEKKEESSDDEEDKKEASRRAPSMRPEARSNPKDYRSSAAYEKAYRSWMRNGVMTRDLTLGTDSTGGYLVTPTKLSNDFIVALNNFVFMRDLADIETLTEAKSLGVPNLATDISDADWTAEVPTITSDSSMAFGRRDLTPNLLCKLALLSHRLIVASSKPEQIAMERLAYKFAVAQEKAFLTGDGSGKPLGVFTASSSGISTGRDVTATGSSHSIAGDDIHSMVGNIPQQYQKSKSFGWIMGRAAITQVRKLKDGQGQYLWQPGLAADRPDTLAGFPVYQSEYAPSTFSTNAYIAVLGDYKYYKIAEVMGIDVQRLVERYADTNQIGFLGRTYLDGCPTLEAAFSRLKLA